MTDCDNAARGTDRLRRALENQATLLGNDEFSLPFADMGELVAECERERERLRRDRDGWCARCAELQSEVTELAAECAGAMVGEPSDSWESVGREAALLDGVLDDRWYDTGADTPSGLVRRCRALAARPAGEEPYASFEGRVDGVYADGHDMWTVALDGTGGTVRLCVADPPDMRAVYRVTVEKVVRR